MIVAAVRTRRDILAGTGMGIIFIHETLPDDLLR